MNKEKQKILDMIANGKVSAEEGYKLLESLDKKPVSKKGPFKMFKVKVFSAAGDKVNVQIPLQLAKALINAGSKLNINPDVNGVNFKEIGVDLEAIIAVIDDETIGKLVEVETANGDTVEVYVE